MARRRVVIDRAAVVGIDEAEVPQLGPLVDVRHAGRGQFEERLRQRVELAEEGDAPLQGAEVREEGVLLALRQHAVDELGQRAVVRLVRVDPTGVDLRFLLRLEHVGRDPLAELRRTTRASGTTTGHAPSSVW